MGTRSCRWLLRAGSWGIHSQGHDRDRLALAVRSLCLATRAPRLDGADAIQWRRCAEADASAFRRRVRSADFLPADAAEAEFPGSRRAYQPPRPGIDQRAEHRATAVRRDGAARDAR